MQPSFRTPLIALIQEIIGNLAASHPFDSIEQTFDRLSKILYVNEYAAPPIASKPQSNQPEPIAPSQRRFGHDR